MKASHWLLLASLLVPSLSQAADNDPSLELIELLGEMDDEEVDLEIAMANVKVGAKQQATLPEEVEDDE
jgi:hypothetical protein